MSDEDEKTKRAILHGLGYDPETHTIEPRAGVWRGLLVRDEKRRPVQFLTAKQVKKLGNDKLFMQGYAEAQGL